MIASECGEPGWIVPEWPCPAVVHSLITTRRGGVSQGVYASLNLGQHVGDEPGAVMINRARVLAGAKSQAVWLNQIHGTRVIDAARFGDGQDAPTADAAFSRAVGIACVIMSADCLPVLFCDDAGCIVAAAHAGWRGLLAGVLERTIAAMGVAADHLMAYFGPAIGAQAFEVGDDVRSAFVAADAGAVAAFAAGSPGKWLADIGLLARQRLAAQGVNRIFGGTYCTFSDVDRFFSYRRDGQTGRMASMVWLDRS